MVDRLHTRVRQSPLLYRFVLATRILLAVGFIPTGMVKLTGQRFTTMDSSTPLGAFFEAMYQSGAYWRFIGATQILASILILVPRTAPAGAVIFMPIITNIFVITLSYDFAGTPVITGLMLLATISLLCWDWHRLRGIVSDAPPMAVALPVHRLTRAERVVYPVGVVSAMAALLATRSLLPPAVMGWGMLVAAGAAFVAGALAALAALRRPRASAGV